MTPQAPGCPRGLKGAPEGLQEVVFCFGFGIRHALLGPCGFALRVTCLAWAFLVWLGFSSSKT